jgi:hypothetical protein
VRFVESKTRTLVRPHSRLEPLRGQGAGIPHSTSAARAVGAARVRNLSAGAGLEVCVVRLVSQDVSRCMRGMLVPHATAGRAASLTCRWERRALLDEQKHRSTVQQRSITDRHISQGSAFTWFGQRWRHLAIFAAGSTGVWLVKICVALDANPCAEERERPVRSRFRLTHTARKRACPTHGLAPFSSYVPGGHSWQVGISPILCSNHL